MTYSNSFGQQPRRRPSYGGYSAMGQQRQPASSGNWQSAMAAGGQPSGGPRDLAGERGLFMQEPVRYGQQQPSAAASMSRQYQQQGQGAGPRDLAGERGLFMQEPVRYGQQYAQQRQASYGQQQAYQGGQQPRPYGIQQSNAAAMQRQYQQQGQGGYGGQQYRGEQRGYMPDPGSGYRPGQGGGYGDLRRMDGGSYGGGQQGGPVYDPRTYMRASPFDGVMEEITPAQRDAYGRLTGYNVDGSPTYDRQRFEAEQLGRINGVDTLQGRAQTLTERLGLGQLGISERQQRLQEMVQTGQLSIDQARQALAERSNEQQYGLQGQRLGLDTELGRGDLDLRRLQNAQDWQYRMAQTSANPANAATMAALSGNAPWLRPQQPQIAARPGSPLSSAQTGVLSGREMNYNTYGRLNPSEQAAYGSYARAAYGVEPGDLEQQMRQYAPGQGSGMQTARWR